MLTLGQWLQQGPFTLVMSSGYFSFFAHTGVVAALESAGYIPNKLSGASAGAMVAAGWASGLSPSNLSQYFCALKKADFWDPSFGLGVLAGKRFRNKLRELLPVEKMELCKTPVSISLYNVLRFRTDVLREGALADIVYASCAVPVMFQPIVINKQVYLDGGINDRPGLAGVNGSERVLYHHILPRPFRENHPTRHYDLNAGLRIRPHRENMATLILSGLPMVGPDALHRGQVAFDQARKACLKAFERPMDSSLFVVDTSSC